MSCYIDLQIDLTTILIFVFELDHVEGVGLFLSSHFLRYQNHHSFFALAIVMMTKDSIKDSLHSIDCLMSKPNQTSSECKQIIFTS